MKENIAKRVVRICGGANVVAKWLHITSKSVHCWGYPKERGGSDGIIPAKYQQEILDKAIKHGTDLKPEDFFCKKTQKTISDLSAT